MNVIMNLYRAHIELMGPYRSHIVTHMSPISVLYGKLAGSVRTGETRKNGIRGWEQLRKKTRSQKEGPTQIGYPPWWVARIYIKNKKRVTTPSMSDICSLWSGRVLKCWLPRPPCGYFGDTRGVDEVEAWQQVKHSYRENVNRFYSISHRLLSAGSR